jgi:hypothetical protein
MEHNMKRTMIAVAAAAVVFGTLCVPSYAAPIAPVQAAVTSNGGNVVLAYYYRGRYYPYYYRGHYYRYRWHGRYYPYRWHGHFYRYRYFGRYCNYRYYRHGRYYCR